MCEVSELSKIKQYSTSLRTDCSEGGVILFKRSITFIPNVVSQGESCKANSIFQIFKLK
jgi:hypothetical protein